MAAQSTAGEARVEGDEIVFRVPLAALSEIVSVAEDGCAVTDVPTFTKALLEELNHEDEVGDTPFHRMFDECIREAINQGADGITMEGENDE